MNKSEISNTSNKNSKICKTVVILGSSGTGKTNILQRYTKRRFEESYIETIGVDYYSKQISTQYGNMVLSIWDTCGNEIELKVLPSNVYKVASAYVIVCSYDIKESFDNLRNWVEHVQYYLSNMRNTNNLSSSHLIPVIVLINKSDVKKDRKFKISDVMSLVDEFTLNIIVYEVSAKENNKLDYIFERMAGMMTGKISGVNESSMNTTILDDGSVIDRTVSTSVRRRSFQLQPLKSRKADKEMGVQGSCCK